MKAKKIITLAIAGIMAASTVVSASADQYLTETNPSGRTEVIANIQGIEPGEVTYMIAIPDVVNFGTLTIPTNSEDHPTVPTNYTVTLESVNGLDPTTQAISVYVKDQNATSDDRAFQIANKANSAIEFDYDIYRTVGTEDTLNESNRVNNGDFYTNGYYLTSFSTQGEALDGTLLFHEDQLYGQNVADIAGEYSGYMVFFSAIENI